MAYPNADDKIHSLLYREQLFLYQHDEEVD